MNRVILICLIFYKAAEANNCWWSGCQPTNWAQRGCSPGYYQINTQSCDGNGDKYHCCPNGSPASSGQGQGDETGMCSWYGADGEIPHGHPTASGEPFNRFSMNAAHKTLPFGTRIRLTNTNNGKSVDVTVNDRGPYRDGRIVDLTYGAFGLIENRDVGVVRCTYSII